MKNSLKLYPLAVLFAITFALFPPTLHAQYVYVNDNVNTGTNSVYVFKHGGGLLAAIGGDPFPTQGTSVLHLAALRDQLLYTGIGVTCLYISEPLPSTSSSLYPNGDIAMFTVNTVTGVPTYVTSYATPAGVSSSLGIGLTAAVRASTHYLYAGYSDASSNTIVSWEMNATNCTLVAQSVHPVTPLNGGNISGIAEANNGNYLVVTYNDGSIQSFSTPASGAINPTCATAIDSTGFLNQGSMPAGVDITSDGRYAIFGDLSGPYPYGPTELETIKVPISCSATTKDFGGTAAASSTHLGSFSNSENVWISPDGQLIYVSNNGPFSPKGLTSVNYSETTNTMSLVSGCTAGHTNPTALAPPLNSGTFFSPRGIQTSATSGNGAYVYVAEYYGPEPPSAVALLDVDSVGCTKEHLSGGHPFSDPDGTGGASNVSAMPPRPF